MADTKHAPHMGYGPDMDGRAHEATYTSFVHFAAVAVAFVLCCAVAFAVGGVKHAWLSAVFGLLLAHIAAALRPVAPSLSWRAAAAVLGLLLFVRVLYRLPG